MALTRTLVRAAAVEAASPAEALRRVNDLLMPDTRQGMFVTAVYAVLDQISGDFTYANAGHNPPFWIRVGGQIEKLTRTGIALGVIEANPITQRTLRIRPGEGVLLYTDGVTEAFSPDGSLFGESRLLEVVRSNGSSPAETLLNMVDASLDEFIGSSLLSDDLTLLVVRRK
jgi:sigma-B regulation protein RsbU (phosphoserine phosphatase)